MVQTEFDFDGPTFERPKDGKRLNKQFHDVFDIMAKFGAWFTLKDLAQLTGYPESSISARIRDFRKVKFGFHQVNRHRSQLGDGTWEYQLIVNPKSLSHEERANIIP